MPVRLRITLLFSLMVSAILSLVCISVYYFSYLNRVNTFKTRLTNRAITTARLLNQSAYFDRELLRKIDASTRLAMKNNTIQVYDHENQRVYWYSDSIDDTISVETKVLERARLEKNLYFSLGLKDMIAYHDSNNGTGLVVIAAAYDEIGKKNLDRLKLILWLSLGGGVVISVIGGYIFSGTLLRPIRMIANEVNEISAQNLTRRINTGTVRDEWHYLSETLNELMNRLQDSFELQQRFISNASHELSTPLTAISSQLEVALQREREVEDYKLIMQSIYQDVRNLSHLTRTLLEFAKASGTAGGITIDLVRIDELLLELPSYMKKINDAYTVTLSFDRLPAEVENLLVAGNEDLLFTAVKNLVSNACKYSDNHLAKVNLTVNESDLVIDVEDEGKGIAPGEIENIFQPFYRTEETKFEPGFGLGLSLANRIIKLHKGYITVRSVSGKGTTFTIILPIASAVKEF